MIPATVYDRVYKALRASESLAQYLAEIALALEWVDSQKVIVTEAELTELRSLSEYVGATVHEGLRWPPFGANSHRHKWNVEVME